MQFLILGAKARAALSGRSHVDPADVQFCAKPVLRHRMVVNFAAESDGVTSDAVIERLISNTPTAQDELLRDADSKEYLHPEAIRRIASMELRARNIVEGFMSGMHRSPYLDNRSSSFSIVNTFAWR